MHDRIVFKPVHMDSWAINRDSPLFIGHCLRVKGKHHRKRKELQAQLNGIAIGWYNTLPVFKKNCFVVYETYITNLTSISRELRPVLEKFFHVVRQGYNFHEGNNKSASFITPKRLNQSMVDAVEALIKHISSTPAIECNFKPKAEPICCNYLVTTVSVSPEINKEGIFKILRDKHREELIPEVEWLLGQKDPIKFYYTYARNKSATREYSVWPIKNIESWPGDVRHYLFGRSIDIDTAYGQYLLSELRQYVPASRLILSFPDLIKSVENKSEFRDEIRELMNLEDTLENYQAVKKLIMTISNGSNASPSLLRMVELPNMATRIVREYNPHLNWQQTENLGKRLRSIARQFRHARKLICINKFKRAPTRYLMKKVFSDYFKWEHDARHKIWELVGNTGLQLHDAVEGIKSDLSSAELEAYIKSSTGIKVNVINPVYEFDEYKLAA